MQLGKTFYAKNRREWGVWLSKHHRTAPEIWLVYYKKASGKPRIPYNDAVEEALCFGWIDSTLKPIDGEKFAQRFSPRRKNSPLSQMNKERVRRLIAAKKMTRFGLASIDHHFDSKSKVSASQQLKNFKLPQDILQEIQRDPDAWKNFRKFPESYKRIRVGWIDGARHRPDEFQKRLRYFLKMTARNKRFGMVQ